MKRVWHSLPRLVAVYFMNVHLYIQARTHSCRYRSPAIKGLAIQLIFVDKNWQEWDEEEVLKVVEVLRGVVSISMYKSSTQAVNVYHQFLPLWGQFLAMLDPFVVIADVGAALPANFLAATGVGPAGAAVFPGGGLVAIPALVPILPANYAWSFLNMTDAAYFMGWMQGVFPGLHFFVVQTLHPVSYY